MNVVELGETNSNVAARKRSFHTLSEEAMDESPPYKISSGYNAKRPNINTRISSNNVNIYADEAAILELLSKYAFNVILKTKH